MSHKAKPPKDFDDNPEWTKADFARAVKLDKPTPLAELGKMISKKRGRPPINEKPRTQVTLRIDAEVLSAYRKLGTGWQSRINDDLVKASKKLKIG